jgi:hypothetical protein
MLGIHTHNSPVDERAVPPAPVSEDVRLDSLTYDKWTNGPTASAGIRAKCKPRRAIRNRRGSIG